MDYEILVVVHIPTEAGNKMLKDPNGFKNLENYLDSVKTEAVYFSEDNGERAIYLVVDIASADMISSIGEPLFQGFNAKVEFKPAMVLEDVKKALQALQK